MITFLSFSLFMSNYSPLLLLFLTLWSAAKPGMLRLCCVGSCFHVLSGVALLSVHNMPDLTSPFQEDVQASCLKPVLPVALVQSNTRPALGSVNVTLTCPVDPETGVIKCKKTIAFSDLSALVCECAYFLCIPTSKTFMSFLNMSCCHRNCMAKTGEKKRLCNCLYCCQPLSCTDGCLGYAEHLGWML